MGRRGNIVKFNKKIDFNIGYVVFIVIILYLAISVIIYAASDKVVIYEVNKGSLSLNNVYSGIIARDEQIVKSEYSGNINYYMDDKEKTDKVTVIYSVDETKKFKYGFSNGRKYKRIQLVYNENNLKFVGSYVKKCNEITF